MSNWLEWGIPIMAWLQGLGAGLTAPMRFFTFLGQEEFYLLVMPAILWSFDAKLGFRIGLVLLTSAGLNGVLKQAFGWPRPYWVSGQVRAMSTETSFGMPSGHAQNSLAVWGCLAKGIGRGWAYLGLGLLVLLISISRLYLGVHFPADLLGGWLAGGLLLWAFLRFEEPVRIRLARLPAGVQIVIVFLTSYVLVVLGQLIAGFGPSILPDWVLGAASAAPESEAIDPRDVSGIISSAGALFGLGAGGVSLFAWGGFDAGGVWWKRTLRFLFGVIGVAALFFGLKAVFPPDVQALRYLRYAAVGYWVSYLGPRAFVTLRLA
jgi:membrane-associated phospholipid phosphatase